MEIDEVLRRLNTSRDGLSTSEARKRLEIYGPNDITRRERISPLRIFLQQFADPLVYILMFAVVVSAFLGETVDAILITIILAVNGVLGFLQEYKAERAVEALREMLTPRTRVLRDGRIEEIPSTELVPGDIVVLELGDVVPADCRLLEADNLRVDESILTGESIPVNKRSDVILPEEAPLAERQNMLFMNTAIVDGRAKAVVVATGMRTEVGRIAEFIQRAEKEKSVFVEEMERLSSFIFRLVIGLSAMIFILGSLIEKNILEMFMEAVALAVAVVPEGLPVAVTVALALGVQRMSKRNALVRRMRAVEVLGSVQVILTDKTGTLTHNKMTLREIFSSSGRRYSVTGEGYTTRGEILNEDGSKPSEEELEEARRILRIGAACTEASLEEVREGEYRVIGDPLEGAILIAALKAGLDLSFDRIKIIGFSPARRRMTVVIREGSSLVSCVKGAPEVILERSTRYQAGSKIMEIDREFIETIKRRVEEMASRGLRILAFAYKPVSENDLEDSRDSRRI